MSAPIMTTGERLLAALELPATNDDIDVGLAELDKRKPDYLQAEQYYRNRVPEFFASPRMRRALEKTGTAFKINFAAIPVKAVVHRIKVASTVCPGNDEATAWIARQWERNELDLYLPDVIRAACTYGDSYLLSWEAADDETADDLEDAAEDLGDIDAPEADDSRDDQSDNRRLDLDIHLNLPLTTVAIYDAENPRRLRFLLRRWDAGDRVRVELCYRDRIEKYATKKGVKVARSKADLVRWRDDEDDEWPAPNPYRLIPGYHFRTERPYGVPVHGEFFGAQDAIRKLIVSHLATVDYQSARQRYALVSGDDTSEAAAVDEDEFAIADTDTGATRNRRGLSADSQLEGGPDTMWWLKNVSGVGVFPEADPDVFLKPAEQYLRFGAQVSETPMRLFDYARAQLPSGVSQDVADVPFVKKIEDLIASFRATLQAMWRDALRMAGFGTVPVVVTFAPPERVTGAEGWAVVAAKIKAGIPPRIAIMEAGYTPDQVEAMLGGDDGNIMQRLAVLVQLSEALQMLGAAASLNVLTPEQISELVEAFLGDAVTAVSGPERDGDG
ncbi:hypothetical protein AB0425_17395 [Actinosynnema sp. NPDC051121]